MFYSFCESGVSSGELCNLNWFHFMLQVSYNNYFIVGVLLTAYKYKSSKVFLNITLLWLSLIINVRNDSWRNRNWYDHTLRPSVSSLLLWVTRQATPILPFLPSKCPLSPATFQSCSSSSFCTWQPPICSSFAFYLSCHRYQSYREAADGILDIFGMFGGNWGCCRENLLHSSMGLLEVAAVEGFGLCGVCLKRPWILGHNLLAQWLSLNKFIL